MPVRLDGLRMEGTADTCIRIRGMPLHDDAGADEVETDEAVYYPTYQQQLLWCGGAGGATLRKPCSH